MKSLNIQIPEGYEIASFDQSTGEIKFKEKPKNIMERITSIQSALSELGETDNEVIRYRKLLTVFDDPTDHLVNYQTAVVLIRAINEKREPDWNNTNESKYFNYFDMRGSSGFRFGGHASWNSLTYVGSRLCFFKPEHGKYLAEKFPDVFKNFMLIIKK